MQMKREKTGENRRIKAEKIGMYQNKMEKTNKQTYETLMKTMMKSKANMSLCIINNIIIIK